MIEGFNFRFAIPEDAAGFAEWAAQNKEIPHEDVLRAMKENNPTSSVLVVTLHDKPVLYVPVYAALRIAFLGFSPETTANERLAAMEMMLLAVKLFAANFGVNEINTLTKTGYPVAQWAKGHGFKAETRELYELKVSEPTKHV